MNKRAFFAVAMAVVGFASTAMADVTVTDNGDGSATVTGTASDDHIVLEEWEAGFGYVIDINAGYEVVGVLDLSEFSAVTVLGLGGNDILENRDVNILFFAQGGDGNDDLYGSELAEGYDDLDGGAGDDFIYGGLGFEYMQGGAGGDYLFAGSWAGGDTQGSTLIGGAGQDTLIATANDDTIVADDGEYDYIDCVAGFDFGPFAGADEIDEIVNCDDDDLPE